MDIKCIRYRPASVGAFRGFADFAINDLAIEIFGCTVYHKDGKRWINLPVRSYKNDKGEEKYAPVVRFVEQTSFRTFCENAKIALDEYEENKKEEYGQDKIV
jgi:hypothetical protein